MARDWRGIPFSTLPEPTSPDFTFRLRNMLSEMDAWARDQSLGLARISRGEVPDGSGGPLSSPPVDLSQFFYLPGRGGGQIGYGGTAASEDLTLGSTIHATKGNIFFGSNSSLDETNVLLGIGDASPNAVLHANMVSPPTYIFPDADSVDGGWQTQSGGTVLFSAVNDSDDTDYITEVSPPGSGTLCELRLWANGANPLLSGQTVAVNLRLKRNNGGGSPAGTEKVRWRLYLAGVQKATATSSFIAVSGSFVDFSTTLSASEVTSMLGAGAGTIDIALVGLGDTTLLYQISQVALVVGAQSDLVRWDSSGTQLGRIDSSGRLGVGTSSDSLSAMLTVEPSSSSTVGEIILGAASQSGNLFEFRNSASALLSRFTSAGILDGPIETTSTVYLKGSVEMDGINFLARSPLMWCDISGTFSGTGPALTDGSGFSAEFQLPPAALTANRVYVFPDATGNVLLSGNSATIIANTVSTFDSSTSSTGAAFKDLTTSSKKLRFVLSGAVGNNSITLANTALRNYTLGDVSSGLTQLGITTSAAGTLGRTVLTGQSGSLGAQTLLTSTTVTAGLYRVSFYLKTTTAGDALDNVTVTLAWNDGTAQTEVLGFIGTTSNIVPYTNHDLATNNAFSHADVVVRAAASTAITYTTTLTSPGAGTPVYTIDARLEFLG